MLDMRRCSDQHVGEIVLAEVAGVELVRIHLLLLGGCARRRNADCVLKAVSQLTRYT